MKNYTQHKTLDKNFVIEKINDFLKEDLPHGDITTNATISEDRIIEADIIALENMIFSGSEIIPHCFDAETEMYINDGDIVTPNSIIGTIKGKSKSILSRERLSLIHI